MNLFLIFSCALFFASCGNDGSGYDYEAIAGEYCACVQPLVDINKEIRALAGQQAKMQALFPKVQALYKETEACSALLKQKYAAMTEAQENSTQEAMATVCPETYAMQKAAKKMEGR